MEKFSVAYKKSKVPGTTHRQHQAEGNAITEVQVTSPAGRKHRAGWTAPLPPSGWHILKKQQVGKADAWGFHGVPPTLHKQSCYNVIQDILHHSQLAKEWSLYPFLHTALRASGSQPWDWFCHCSNQTVPFLPEYCRPLCTGVLRPTVSPLIPLCFHLLYTCLMQIHRNKLFLFSCLQESLISVRPLFPITSVTQHWRQEHRDCRKIYIYLHP